MGGRKEKSGRGGWNGKRNGEVIERGMEETEIHIVSEVERLRGDGE